jgi:signal transduction histidine kinase/DNA-binding response OmpR family regulator
MNTNSDSLYLLSQYLLDLSTKLDDKKKQANAYHFKGIALARLSKMEEAMIAFEKSIDISSEIGYDYKIAAVSTHIGVAYTKNYDYDMAMNYFRKADSIYRKIGYRKGAAAFELYQCIVFYEKGDYPKALQHIYKSLEILDEVGEGKTSGRGWRLGNISMILADQGNYKEALEWALEARDIYKEKTDTLSQASNYQIIGRIYLEWGNYPTALEYLDKSLNIYRHLQLQEYEANTLIYIADVHIQKGDYRSALKRIDEVLKIIGEVPDYKILYATCYERIGYIHDQLEDYTSSLEHYNYSLQILEEIKSNGRIGELYDLMGQVHFKKGDNDFALEYYRRALDINLEIGRINEEAKNYMHMGSVIEKEGDHTSALEYYYKSREISERIGDKKGSAEVYLNIGRLRFKEGDLGKAKYWAENSHRLILELGALKLERDACNLLYKINRELGNGSLALSFYERCNTLKDSLKIDEAYKQLQQIEFERQRAVDSLAMVEKNLKSELEFKEKLNKERNTRNTYMFAGLGILLIAGGLFSRMLYIRRTNKELELKNKIIAQEKEKAVHSEKAKEQFFDNVSHEFRTPLTLILGPLGEALEKTTDSKVKPNLEIMHRNASRLQKMIDELLDLSKLEFGKVKLETRKINLVKLTAEFLQSFESLADQRNIELGFKSMANEYLLWVDAEKIRKVLANLLSNAFKYTRKGGKISVKISESYDRTGVLLTVSDTGIGIPENKLPHIFERFYQAGDTTPGQQAGTGIGLALTKELVQLHQGTIEVESTQGIGSTFIVFLPSGMAHLKPEELADANNETKKIQTLPGNQYDLAEEKEQPDFSQVPNGNGNGNNDHPKILIVEDNDDMRAYIRSQIMEDFEILEANNGVEGLEMAYEFIPDLIISDVMMPEMDGNEMTEKLKTDLRTSHIPVVILTARASVESKIEGLETGADAYLTKPFTSKELCVRVRKLIEQRQKLQRFYERNLNIGLVPETDDLVSMEEQFLHKATQVVHAHMADTDFDSTYFAAEMALSRAQLHRKIKALTNKTTNDFIRTIRLNRAAELLKEHTDNVTQIAYETGFSSLSWFAKVFKEKFGVSPSEYGD